MTPELILASIGFLAGLAALFLALDKNLRAAVVCALAAWLALAGAVAHAHPSHKRRSWWRHLRGPVTVSWYAPGGGFACGGSYDAGVVGVAHRYLPCGTHVTLCAVRCAVARVVDRGPFVAGRTFDATAALKARIGMSDLDYRVRWQLTPRKAW